MKPQDGTYRLTPHPPYQALPQTVLVQTAGAITTLTTTQGVYTWSPPLDGFMLGNPNVTMRCLGVDEKGEGEFVAIVQGMTSGSGTCVKL